MEEERGLAAGREEGECRRSRPFSMCKVAAHEPGLGLSEVQGALAARA